MGKIKYKKNLINFYKINPYSTLGITDKTEPEETKRIFRKKLLEAKDTIIKKAKICMAYDVIVNKDVYIKCEKDFYKINENITNILPYYYTIIGDCEKLIPLIEKNPKLLYYKDSLGRNLLYIAARNGHTSLCEYYLNKGITVNDIQKTGSTALHGAVYYEQTSTIKLLLNYGAKTNIKNNYGHFPIDETLSKEIINLLKESEIDPIAKLYQSLLSKNIAKKLIPIYLDGKIIGKKIEIKLINLPSKYDINRVEKEWIVAWHGTNFSVLESIAKIGLKPAGGELENGEENKVCTGHVSRDTDIDDIPDWANGIFVSPSIFYSAYEAYAKEICCNNEQWKVIVEVRVKPYSYYERKSTCPQYKPKIGEPKMLEFRIPADQEKDVQVYSFTFVKNEFFKNAQKYIEGGLFGKK
jgi:ankyrin repeat protein